MSKDYRQFCGLAKAASVLGERWALLVIRDLSIEARRFTELHVGLPSIPTSVLTTRLRELETAGVVERQLSDSPQRGVVYQLTDYGKQLEPILDALGRWGAEQMSTPASHDVITSASLAAALRSAFQPGALDAATSYVVQAGPAIAWASATNSYIVVGSEIPDFSPDVTIHAGPEIRHLLAGKISSSEALSSGAVEITGAADALEIFSRAFYVPLDEPNGAHNSP